MDHLLPTPRAHLHVAAADPLRAASIRLAATDMMTEVKFFAFSGMFSLLVAAVYWFLSYEPAGSTLLLFMFLSPIFVAAYVAYRAGRTRRPEDDPDAEHVGQAGAPVGRFHSGSLWPFLMG